LVKRSYMDDLEIKSVSLADLSEVLTKQGEDYFRRLYPCSFLLLANQLVSEDEIDSLQLKTIESVTGDFKSSLSLTMSDRLVPLLKSNRNVFNSRITIGRAPNNDIIISSHKISRLHAMIVLGDNDLFTVMDMGSSNGTFVNEIRLEPKKPVPIKDGDLLRVWRIAAEFHTVSGTIRLLKERATSK